MTPFDLENTPLDGVHLIEAGAGTGKTYTIAGIFLRLIVERGVSIDRILVVTYTKAATEELKSRIRGRLLSAKAVLNGQQPAEPLFDAMCRNGVTVRQALDRIQDALVDFDQAAIFTIHGFCQRVLHHFAFETGHLFDAELVQDAQPLVQETADDFWRRNVSRAPMELACFVTDHLKGPRGLAALMQHSRFPGLRLLPEGGKPPPRAIAPWRRAAHQVVTQWPAARSAVAALLHSPALSGTVYGGNTADPQRPGMTRRQRKVADLTAAMDQWPGDYPLWEGFEKLTAARVAGATKKGHAAPQHPFLDLCDHALACHVALADQLTAYLRYLKIRFLQQAEGRLRDKKQRRNVLFYDDLLLQVHHALAGDGRAGLVAAIRGQYQAALVDEFQDTDPLQYTIFHALFADRHPLLFMIGDPKQAIYSFRGADLFSYLQARRNARRRHTLTRNWRATAPLIDALNTLFAHHPRPFGFEQIPYERAIAADTVTEAASPPFVLWHLTRDDTADLHRPIPRHAALPRIVDAVGEEIVRLLADEAVAPQQIAVLTRTHHQAQAVKSALARRRVPAVLHSAGRVFDTPEAEALAVVLDALAAPADPRKVRTALATVLLGADAAVLCATMDDASATWQAWWARCHGYHQVWQRYGFFRMFSHFMAREGIKGRLRALADGERRLTNLLHLAELLHQADRYHAAGPEGVLKWLADQRQSDAATADTEMLRLESDARAVRVITIHKSKGLQFDVVFCPFTWEGVKVTDDAAVFHDPAVNDQLTLAIGPGLTAEQQRQAAAEALSENLRLFYVAVTRARRRCYMVWGAIRDTELSATAYLLHGTPDMGQDWMAALHARMKAMTDSEMVAELQTLAGRSEGTIAVASLPEAGAATFDDCKGAPVRLTRRTFARTFDGGWRVASFSAMTADHSPGVSDPADRDDVPSATAPAADYALDFRRLADFPKGTAAGLFFHDLLEHWDFTQGPGAPRTALVNATLAAHGFDARWAEVVDRMLSHLAAAPLPTAPQTKPLRLADVPRGRRMDEMDFYLPLNRVSPERLQSCFAAHGRPHMADLPVDPLERLTFASMHGYLRGFIDALFAHEGRYYLVDWKSNHLGDTPADYTVARLARVMAESYYFLQYHLYVLALDQLLRRRLPGYDYQRHFGGVYYLFIRGVEGPVHGVYHDLPDEGLIADLRRIVTPIETSDGNQAHA
ncbi:exodeoxyribonuclease V subunit beta [Desulfatitalea alkaliphila]|uniref:DNA 3'-5' helicase n=1 Tax=Desulfatitalea alkaliphila TaxID=2929485 RepID=A0AA41R462_9BACT|nr:exodeoxyribonuclease V subunit beta [Desulfatitalea alkaliphila]MCJ8500555.1 exodeoxyribonuclease V subunit beta [Desulfatitalea alkaliphila]